MRKKDFHPHASDAAEMLADASICTNLEAEDDTSDWKEIFHKQTKGGIIERVRSRNLKDKKAILQEDKLAKVIPIFKQCCIYMQVQIHVMI